MITKETLDNDPENMEDETIEEIEEEGGEPKKQSERMYSKEEVDELLAKKIGRTKAKLERKHAEELNKYSHVGDVLNAGLGTTTIEEATENLTKFYEEQGIIVPVKKAVGYAEEDLRILAKAEADKIISLGEDEIAEELARLEENELSAREKMLYSEIKQFSESKKKENELLEIGVSKEVIESADFKEFAKDFNEKTSIKKIYNLYEKMQGENGKPLGSVKNQGNKEVKSYYTKQDVDKLSSEDYDKPGVMEAIRKSMLKW